MNKKANKGNPRQQQPRATDKVDSSIAKERATKTGGAKSGNPRADKKKRPVELEGFTREYVSEIRVKPEKRERQHSKKLEKIKKQKDYSKEKRDRRRSIRKMVLVSMLVMLVAGIIVGVIYLLKSDALEIREVEYVVFEFLCIDVFLVV